jgi:DNA polymerase elongation subunit (family B)
MSSFNFFPFQWSHSDEYSEDGKTLRNIIRIYGWNETNASVYVRVEDFHIPIWVELPNHIEWTEDRVRTITNKFMNFDKSFRPSYIALEMRQRLYYAEVFPSNKTEYKYQKRRFPYLCTMFSSMKALETFKNIISSNKGVVFPEIGNLQFKCHCYKRAITPVLKLLAVQDLPSASWISGKGLQVVNPDDKESSKDREYICSYKDLKRMSDEKSKKMPIVYPKVLSFDNESYSSDPNCFPSAKKHSDKVFQVGCTLLTQTARKKEYKKYLLTLAKNGVDPIEDVEVRIFKTEEMLYYGFIKLVQETNPDIVLGYNIFGYDITYMDDRFQNFYGGSWDGMSCISSKKATIETISWESSAYGKQDLKYISAEGRLFLDMLPYIRRNYTNLPNYRLETVCTEFLKDTNKDPLKAKDIFKCYEKGTSEAIALVGKYCVQDSAVTLQLYEKLLVWFDLFEAATTNAVPMFYLYTAGQQIKMFSQLLNYCIHHDIVVESDVYKATDKDQFEGAFVAKPKSGLYKNIVPFDFASLYPSIIMAYNLDYSTLCLDPKVPDSDCYVFDIHQHKNCKHDPTAAYKKPKKGEEDQPQILKKNVRVMCGDFKFRFLKHSVVGKGVVPTLLENLIAARKKTRKEIEANESTIEELEKEIKETSDEEKRMKIQSEIDRLEAINNVLDKRQLSYKVSANSMYGALGTKTGYLPLPPAAMCVTHTGKHSILKANEFLESNFGGVIIYNDTDSAYTYFPHLDGKSMREVYDYCEDVAEKIVQANLFPKPMKLEFEGKVYAKFLILTKKRYCALVADANGNISSKLAIRGIVLKRRDNCKFLRDIYQDTIFKLLDYIDVLTNIKNRNLTSRQLQDTPAVKDLLNNIVYGLDSLFQMKYNYKSFVITKTLTRLPGDYKSKTIPAHAYLALKKERRGDPVGINSRLEYVFLNTGKGYIKDEKQHDKIEDAEYFGEFREVLRMDYLYYLEKQIIKPIDELLKVCLGLQDFMKSQFKHRVNKNNLIVKMKNHLEKSINFVE